MSRLFLSLAMKIIQHSTKYYTVDTGIKKIYWELDGLNFHTLFLSGSLWMRRPAG